MKGHKCGFCEREITDSDLGRMAYSTVWKLPADYLDGEALEHAYETTGQRLRDFIETGEVRLCGSKEADERFLQELRRRREEVKQNGQG